MTNDGERDGKAPAGGSHPGMMGDGTEEQNLGQPGDPAARITEDEVKDAFGAADAERDDGVTPIGPQG